MIAHETIDLEGEVFTEYHQVVYLPADPALKAVYLDDEGEVFFGPILFWQIHTVFVPDGRVDAFPSPVTPAGEESSTPVLYPDGVVRSWEESYESVDVWVKQELEFREERRRVEEREEKDKARKENSQ